MSKKTIAFGDADLDGSSSIITLSWKLGYKVPHIISPSNEFRTNFSNWLLSNKIEDYENIWILDLDVSSCIDLIDHENVIIFDHHESHLPNKDLYKKATVSIELITSTCKLVCKRIQGEKLSIPQQYFVLLADDYDSYQFKLPETRCLNTLFWNYQGDRTQKLWDRFKNGYSVFTEEEKNICQFYEKRFTNTVNELKVYTTTQNIKGKSVKFIATFASEFLNDIAAHLLVKHNADVALIMNSKTQKVSIRRSKTSDFDCSKFAAVMGEGGGHYFSAGCKLTDKIAEFSKLFTPI